MIGGFLPLSFGTTGIAGGALQAAMKSLRKKDEAEK
jgi:hypothetical protein